MCKSFRDGNGSCDSLFYWCIIMHERERERGQVSRRLGGWVERKDDERRDGGRKGKTMSVGVVVYGLWFTFHFSNSFLFSPTLWCKFRQVCKGKVGIGGFIYLFVVFFSSFANY